MVRRSNAATPHHFRLGVYDADRGVYERVDVRIARHPSESIRYLLIRVLAYALCYEPGIAFSKGGLSSDEPALAIRDGTGAITTWIEVGAPSLQRLRRATASAPRVLLFTASDLKPLRRELSRHTVRRLETMEAFRVDTALLDALEPRDACWQTPCLIRTLGIAQKLLLYHLLQT
jgi:uncharacterized protein YaeQ